ncbi:MAG: hydrolase [Thermoleophilia bacterium]|nr:hydrolase [Thermoleophilia bacterium]
MTDPLTWHSEIDARFAVPGDARTVLAESLAREVASAERPAFDTPTWQRVAALDHEDGFGTRIASRAVLTRPSDGRFLIFRYPFRDGSSRFVIPGGGAEPGEDAHAAVSREVFEETGTHARDLHPSGLLVYHLLASTIYGADRTPTIQYSPILTGTIDDELPNTGGREFHWFSIDEFEQQPRRPISDPVIEILRASARGETIEPLAVWLPA